jgi:hypothetical protein
VGAHVAIGIRQQLSRSREDEVADVFGINYVEDSLSLFADKMAAEWNVIVQYVRLWGQFQFETTRMGSFRVCSSTKTRTWLKTKKPQKSIRTVIRLGNRQRY